MLPFFPSLRPAIVNNIWFAADESCDDDSEVNAMETEHQEWLNRITHIAADLTPIGKSTSEHMENMDSEDEDANDESDDSDNSDEDDDDMDDINNAAARGNLVGTVMDPAYIGNDDDLQPNDTI